MGKDRNHDIFIAPTLWPSFTAPSPSSPQASSAPVEDLYIANNHDPTPDPPPASTDNESSPRDPSQDEEYFFENIVIKVEDTLFSVPKHGFVVEGSTFADMYKLPQQNAIDGTPCEGSSVDSPIELMGISVLHFRSLLRAIYPYDSERQLTYDDWLGVLRLADMWNLEKIRKCAIEHITPLLRKCEAITQIKLGKQYGVLAWLTEGYASLADQKDTPNVEHLYEQGLDGLTIARIFCLRETVESKRRPSMFGFGFGIPAPTTCHTCNHTHTCIREDQFLSSVRKHIPTIFQAEFKKYDSL